MRISAVLPLLACAVACSKDESAVEPGQRGFEAGTSRIVLEVDYADGAEPYVAGASGADVWNLFEANLRALFGDGKELTVPHRLADMEAIGAVPGASFDAEAILELADRHRQGESGAGTASYYALWLDGIYAEDGEQRADVLGVSIGRTGVIGMFKPVIEGTAIGRAGIVSRYVEQATMIHEFGHAVGLVNNGLAMAAPHQDQANGAHCTNDSCVMYYAVEGVGGVADFVQQYVTTGSNVLFGEECLADAEAAR